MLIGLNSCSFRISSSKVKTRYEYDNAYRTNKNFELSKWRKNKTKIGYIKYDKKGNEIEIAEYGEIWRFRKVTTNPDSSITVTSGHGRHMKKLNTVTFRSYNKSNQIQSEEFWSYKDNKKNYLIHRTEYKYNNGELIGEIEYDEEGKISREMKYNEDKSVQINNKKRPFFQPIIRVEGNSKYEITYDSLGREIEKFHYSNGKFLRRTVTDYQKDMVTISKYDDTPDKLWCYTKEKYSKGKLISSHWNVVDSPTETKDLFEYDENELLIKISHYNLNSGSEELEYYTEYKYKYYKKKDVANNG